MAQVAHIGIGESTFEPRLLEILEASSLEKDDFEDLDYFSLLPFFAIAGASVDTEVHSHGDHFHFNGVKIVVPDELVEGFYEVLPEMLGQVQSAEG